MRVQLADMRPSHSTPAETGTARSARPMHATAGSKRGRKNCCPPATSTWSSRCRGTFRHLRCRTNAKSMPCCSGQAPRHCLRSPAIRSTSARRSDSSASFTPGTRNSSGPFAVDRFASEVLPASRRAQRGVSGQVRERPQRTPCGAQARLPRKPHGASESESLCRVASSAVPLSAWVVYSKRPFGGAQHALRYLGQYTHRVAISNHRLVALSDGMVTFRLRCLSTTSSVGSCCTCCRLDSSASATMAI